MRITVSPYKTGNILHPGDPPETRMVTVVGWAWASRAFGTAWVPGTPVPAHAHAEGTAHTMEMDWIRREGSVEDLTDHSALIVSGRVESTRWCRKPTNITFTDYSGPNWPVGDGMNEWMYNNYNNSLYLYWRASGTSDVMVYSTNYGADNWYGYATCNAASASCIANAQIQLNTYYYSGWHYAKTVSTHEIGHVLGLNHHKDCNSIMYYNPTACAANITTCDMQAVAERYPY